MSFFRAPRRRQIFPHTEDVRYRSHVDAATDTARMKLPPGFEARAILTRRVIEDEHFGVNFDDDFILSFHAAAVPPTSTSIEEARWSRRFRRCASSHGRFRRYPGATRPRRSPR